ncbi:MAG: polyhydroxyalkanoic acid system family protein [Ideonella sp.]|nr:polyhydroxyalkanoic acid system family protein [Ideonella sp.]
MADIHIHREHALGLAKARKIAWKWAEEVEEKFDMACTVIEGETSDTVEFTRTGVHGRLIVAPDHFELDAKLGFLLGAFAGTIEREIRQNLDTLLGAAAAQGSKAAKPAKPAKAAGTGDVAPKATRTAAAPLKRAATRPKTR